MADAREGGAARRLRWFFREWWAEVCLIADEMLEVVWPVK